MEESKHLPRLGKQAAPQEAPSPSLTSESSIQEARRLPFPTTDDESSVSDQSDGVSNKDRRRRASSVSRNSSGGFGGNRYQRKVKDRTRSRMLQKSRDRKRSHFARSSTPENDKNVPESDNKIFSSSNSIIEVHHKPHTPFSIDENTLAAQTSWLDDLFSHSYINSGAPKKDVEAGTSSDSEDINSINFYSRRTTMMLERGSYELNATTFGQRDTDSQYGKERPINGSLRSAPEIKWPAATVPEVDLFPVHVSSSPNLISKLSKSITCRNELRSGEISDCTVSDLLVQFKYRTDQFENSKHEASLDSPMFKNDVPKFHLSQPSLTQIKLHKSPLVFKDDIRHRRKAMDKQKPDLGSLVIKPLQRSVTPTELPEVSGDSLDVIVQFRYPTDKPVSHGGSARIPTSKHPRTRRASSSPHASSDRIKIQRFSGNRDFSFDFPKFGTWKAYENALLTENFTAQPLESDNYYLEFLRPSQMGHRFNGCLEDLMTWEEGRFAEEEQSSPLQRKDSEQIDIFELESSEQVNTMGRQKRHSIVSIKEINMSDCSSPESLDPRDGFDWSTELESESLGLAKLKLLQEPNWGGSEGTFVSPDETLPSAPPPSPLRTTIDGMIEGTKASDRMYGEDMPTKITINGTTYWAETPKKGENTNPSPSSSPLRSRGSVRFNLPAAPSSPTTSSTRNASIDCVRGTPENSPARVAGSVSSSPITSLLRKIGSGVFTKKLSDQSHTRRKLSGVSTHTAQCDQSSPTRSENGTPSIHGTVRENLNKLRTKLSGSLGRRPKPRSGLDLKAMAAVAGEDEKHDAGEKAGEIENI